ncbi:hypothetical protein B0H19DRAFT_1169962 [Mycena capillaripes]|nr:hypothetical protein B0H19DRAFT_1169962 [Mycena capillaripes]
MSAVEAPVLLGRICSSWRAISLSTPRLWAMLHLVEPPGLPDAATLIEAKRAQRLEMAKTWLGRSGQCPLSISLQSIQRDDGSEPTASNQTPTSPFLEALIPFAARWQHLRLATPPGELDAISHLTEADVPMLASVCLNHDVDFPFRKVALENFGMLRSSGIISFSAAGINFRETIPLRWHQLTVLEILDRTWAAVLTSEMAFHIISRCPELRRCKLMVCDKRATETASPHPTMELKFLHTFEFEGETPSGLLGWLSLPELRNFILRGEDVAQHSPSVARFFGICTRLESLDIDSNSFTKSSFLETLRSLPPTIQRLSIRDGENIIDQPLPLDDDGLGILTPSPGVTAYSCPALETLTIRYCRAITDAALLRFITVRTANQSQPQTLKRVEVHFDRPMTLDILPSLQPFIQTGLDVVITHISPFERRFSPWQGLPDDPAAMPTGEWYTRL